MLKELKVTEFIEELASNSPAPGGGAAAALAAALAGALSSMVFNLTIGKKVYNELDEKKQELIQKALTDSNNLTDQYLQAMQDDADTFLELMSFFKLPKSTEEEVAIRRKKISEGYKKALELPKSLAEKCVVLFEIVRIAAEYGNKNAISDAGVAAVLVHAAVESAILNVKINLAAVEDEKIRENILKENSFLLELSSKNKEEILKIVHEKM